MCVCVCSVSHWQLQLFDCVSEKCAEAWIRIISDNQVIFGHLAFYSLFTY